MHRTERRPPPRRDWYADMGSRAGRDNSNWNSHSLTRTSYRLDDVASQKLLSDAQLDVTIKAVEPEKPASIHLNRAQTLVLRGMLDTLPQAQSSVITYDVASDRFVVLTPESGAASPITYHLRLISLHDSDSTLTITQLPLKQGNQPRHPSTPTTSERIVNDEPTTQQHGPWQDEQKRNKLLKELFADLPADPKARLQAVVALQQAFRGKAASELELAVDTLLRTPPKTFVEKQNLVSELNQAFHELSIAACEHGSTQPCSVIANRSRPTGDGWIRLQTRGSLQRQSPPTTKLEKVGLIEAVRAEGLARIR
jgi:hypothetical protein